MPKCSYCGAEFAGARCDNCDTEAADDPTARPDPKWVEIYAGPPQWKELVRKALEAEGVHAAADEEITDWSRAYLGPSPSASVFVRTPDVERASEVLERMKREVPDAFPEGTL